jgi:hypothetical protein
VLMKPKTWERHGLKSWIESAHERMHHNVLAIALANPGKTLIRFCCWFDPRIRQGIGEAGTRLHEGGAPAIAR